MVAGRPGCQQLLAMQPPNAARRHHGSFRQNGCREPQRERSAAIIHSVGREKPALHGPSRRWTRCRGRVASRSGHGSFPGEIAMTARGTVAVWHTVSFACPVFGPRVGWWADAPTPGCRSAKSARSCPGQPLLALLALWHLGLWPTSTGGPTGTFIWLGAGDQFARDPCGCRSGSARRPPAFPPSCQTLLWRPRTCRRTRRE